LYIYLWSQLQLLSTLKFFSNRPRNQNFRIFYNSLGERVWLLSPFYRHISRQAIIAIRFLGCIFIYFFVVEPIHCDVPISEIIHNMRENATFIIFFVVLFPPSENKKIIFMWLRTKEKRIGVDTYIYLHCNRRVRRRSGVKREEFSIRIIII